MAFDSSFFSPWEDVHGDSTKATMKSRRCIGTSPRPLISKQASSTATWNRHGPRQWLLSRGIRVPSRTPVENIGTRCWTMLPASQRLPSWRWSRLRRADWPPPAAVVIRLPGAGPRFVVGTKSPTGNSQESQMIRHLWAADRMWEGLVGPSDEAWTAGAEGHGRDPTRSRQRTQKSGEYSEVGGLLRRGEPPRSGGLNGFRPRGESRHIRRMLDTCNRCHSSVGSQLAW